MQKQIDIKDLARRILQLEMHIDEILKSQNSQKTENSENKQNLILD